MSRKYEPSREKTRLRDPISYKTPTCLATEISWNLEKLHVQVNLLYMYFGSEKNKDADQTSQMHRLVCAFVVRMQDSQIIARQDPLQSQTTNDTEGTQSANPKQPLKHQFT